MLFALFIFLLGCVALDNIFVFNSDATHKGQAGQAAHFRPPHPKGEPSIWVGKKASELVGHHGDPDLILETAVLGIVLYGDTPTVMYVYTQGRETKGCLDAYVVDLESEEILAFHCH